MQIKKVKPVKTEYKPKLNQTKQTNTENKANKGVKFDVTIQIK